MIAFEKLSCKASDEHSETLFSLALLILDFSFSYMYKDFHLVSLASFLPYFILYNKSTKRRIKKVMDIPFHLFKKNKNCPLAQNFQL